MSPLATGRSPRISASVVAFQNEPDQLLTVIKSVADSTLEVALAVVDNSPSDKLRRFVEGLGAKYLFTGKNLGFGKAHNIALQHYIDSSEYHLVLNPDVSFGTEVIGTLDEFMRNNPNVGLVMPRVLYPDSTEQHLCKLVPSPIDLLSRRFLPAVTLGLVEKRLRRYMMQDVDFCSPRFVPVLSGCFMFLRAAVLRKAGSFDERYFMYLEDVDLCRRIGAVADTVYFPGVSIQHEYTKGSYFSWRLLRYHIESGWRYFWKWGWIFDPERDRLNRKAFTDETVYQNSLQLASNCSD